MTRLRLILSAAALAVVLSALFAVAAMGEDAIQGSGIVIHQGETITLRTAWSGCRKSGGINLRSDPIAAASQAGGVTDPYSGNPPPSPPAAATAYRDALAARYLGRSTSGSYCHEAGSGDERYFPHAEGLAAAADALCRAGGRAGVVVGKPASHNCRTTKLEALDAELVGAARKRICLAYREIGGLCGPGAPPPMRDACRGGWALGPTTERQRAECDALNADDDRATECRIMDVAEITKAGACCYYYAAAQLGSGVSAIFVDSPECRTAPQPPDPGDDDSDEPEEPVDPGTPVEPLPVDLSEVMDALADLRVVAGACESRTWADELHADAEDDRRDVAGALHGACVQGAAQAAASTARTEASVAELHSEVTGLRVRVDGNRDLLDDLTAQLTRMERMLEILRQRQDAEEPPVAPPPAGGREVVSIEERYGSAPSPHVVSVTPGHPYEVNVQVTRGPDCPGWRDPAQILLLELEDGRWSPPSGGTRRWVSRGVYYRDKHGRLVVEPDSREQAKGRDKKVVSSDPAPKVGEDWSTVMRLAARSSSWRLVLGAEVPREAHFFPCPGWVTRVSIREAR